MYEYYRYVIHYRFRDSKQLRKHESCLFLNLDECQLHMKQMIVSEMFCMMDEIVDYSVQSMFADPTTIPSAEVFGF